MSHTIREYTHQDIDGINACLCELQDFERLMDPQRLEGVKVAHDYLKHLLALCEQGTGKIFVVEIASEIVGMVSVYIEEDTKQFRKVRRFAVISDLIIMEKHRSDGITRELLSQAESYARSHQVTSIQTVLLKGHEESRAGYLRNGFHEWEIILRKTLS